MTQTDLTRTDALERHVIPNARELAPETREAASFFHAAALGFTTLDPVTLDLCRLKSAHLNDCKW